MRIKVLTLCVMFFIACSSHSQENENKDAKHVHIEKNGQVGSEEKPDTVSAYKYDFRDRENRKWKYYYKEVEEFGHPIRLDKDFIECEEIVINEILPNFSSISLMLEKLGQPDSVVSFYNEIDDSKGEFYYYPAMEFMVQDFDSLVRFQAMKFSNKQTFFSYRGMIFNSDSELDDFKELFPLSYLNATKRKDSNNEENSQYWLDFCTSGKQYTDDKYTLRFVNGKLNSLLYREPM